MQNKQYIGYITYQFITVLYCSKKFYKFKQVSNNLLYNDFIVNTYIQLDGNKFLQLASPSPYKYSNSIHKTNQMTANVQAISIISTLSKFMSN